MLFTQPIFLFFFAVVFALHWLMRRNGARKVLLLVASYIFYAAWDWRFLSLILISTLIDYCVGLLLVKKLRHFSRGTLLVMSLCANLGILGFFKYYNFFEQSFSGLLTLLGFHFHPVAPIIVLPVGISFYTFQSMSYTIDIYRGKLRPTRNFVDFALFVGFFPQLVAGPIVRAAGFLPQLRTARRLDLVKFKGPIALFLCGYFKKAIVSDSLAPLVDRVFAAPETFGVSSVWLAAVFYTVMIYCDFSGYTDMAIAVARLLGYELCVNFDFPYFARNIRVFWQRWHISLSSWLKDYLYISLGGNRGTRFATFRNLMLTMLLGGLWHGASWNFVIWGGLHGLALVIHRLYSERIPSDSAARRFVGTLGIPLTFYWVCLSFIIFRARTMENIAAMLRAFLFFDSVGSRALPNTLWLWLIPLGLFHWLFWRVRVIDRIQRMPDWLCSIAFGLAVFLMLLFLPFEYKPFIYFQF
ncbi:MAG TPA: MBOAT family protein [Candidatus Hydrogenedentes bacterium]|nr:MBOAT family protein [Candidatus Hydrogenedentota bacterium]HIJ73828.1 MBOAT family protein [Candidatus Hydrogenedentota bacterium]